MSDLSEAFERAEKRLAKMTEADRMKYHLFVLSEELRRPGVSIRLSATQGKE